MKNQLSIFIWAILAVSPLTSCKQNDEALSDKYFRLVNNDQKDSLENILSDNFKVTLTYATQFYNRVDFFQTYLRAVRENNEKVTILKTLSNKEPQRFLVEDRSDYLKYLGVSSPTWIVTIKSDHNKIYEAVIDTTNTSGEFFKNVKEKSGDFHVWLTKKYPYDIPTGKLYDTAGLLLTRLKEYKTENP